MKSIKMKLLSYFGALIFIVCIGLGSLSYIISSKLLVDNVNETLPQTAREASKLIDSRLQNQLNSLEAVANIEGVKDPNNPWENKKKILESEAKRSGHLMMDYVDKAGVAQTTTGKTLDLKEREYFKKALSGESNISDPLVSKDDGSVVVLCAVPIKNNNEIIGVLVAVRDGMALSDITNDIGYGKSGKCFIINSKGTKVAHYNKELVTKSDNDLENVKKNSDLKQLANLEEKMIKGEQGTGEYRYNGQTKFMGYAPIKSAGWSIAITAPKDEVQSGVSTLMKYVALLSLVFLIVAMGITYAIGRRISNPIVQAVNHIEIISKGDYTLEVPDHFLKGKDEIGHLAKAVKVMQESIKNMLLTVKNSSEKIELQAESLSAVAEEMSSSADNVSNAVQEVARGTGEQAEDLINITGTLMEFDEQLGNVVTIIKEIDENSKGIHSMAAKSNDEMQGVTDSVAKVTSAFEDLISKIANVGENINQINEITNLINSISEQTNLLALNAAIEAARAGEAGRGFSVVADEIRKLAEQSKVSATDINVLINKISTDTNTMIKTTDTMKDELNNQKEEIATAISSFENITNAVDEINPKIETASKSAMEIDNQKKSILEKIEGASSIAEEVSASSEEIAASSEQMSASTQEVAATAQNLYGMMKEMKEQVDMFKL